MKILVTNFTAGPEARVRVRGSAGELQVRTAADLAAIHVGRYYDLELDIDTQLQSGINAFPSSREDYTMEERDGMLRLNGCVESVDDDGMLYLRLGLDSLTMIESVSGEFHRGEWIQVTLDERDVRAYLVQHVREG